MAEKSDVDPAQMAQYRDAFKLFDKNNDEVIDFKEFEEVTKSIGMDSKPESIKLIIDTIGADNKITFKQFVDVMTGKMKNMDTKKDVLRAFQTFDEKKDGTVRSGQLTQLLRTFYGVMSAAEVQALINEAGGGDSSGIIKYGPFVDKLFDLK